MTSQTPARPARIDIPFTVEEAGDAPETYTLRFSVIAIAALQDHYGLDSLEAAGRKLSELSTASITDLQAIVWAGLQTHHRGLTKERALEILDTLGMFALRTLLAQALTAALPPEIAGEGEGRARPQPPPPSTGS